MPVLSLFLFCPLSSQSDCEFQPLPGSRKAQTRQQFREKLQGVLVTLDIPGPPKHRMVRMVLFPVSTTALFKISELINITDHKVI